MERTITNDKSVKGLMGSIRWNDILLCGIAFVVAKINVEGIFYTFGVAYMGSLYFNKNLRRWGSVFTILGLLSANFYSVQGLKYIIATVLIVLARKYIEYSDEEFSNLNQALIVFCSLAVVGVVENTIRGLNWFGVGISVLEGLVGAGLVIILSYGVKVIKVNRKTYINMKEATSLVVLLIAIILGSTDVYVELPLFVAIYLKDVIAVGMIMAVVYLGGMNIGVTIAFAISIALVQLGYMPIQYVSIFCISAILGGLLRGLGKPGVIIGVGLGELIGFIVFNEGVLDLPLMGAYLVAAIISFIMPDKYFGFSEWFGYKKEEVTEQVHIERVQDIMMTRLAHFTEAFGKISDSFSRVYYKRENLDSKYINYIIEDTKEKVCVDCAMYPFCWKRDNVRTYNTAYQLIQKSDENGMITVGDLSGKFREDCRRAEHFAYTLNFKVDVHKQNIRWENKLVENRLLVAEQLRAVKQSLYRLLEEIKQEVSFNKEEELELIEKLKMKGIKVKDVMIMEKRKRYKKVEVYIPYCKKKGDVEKAVLACVRHISEYRMKVEAHRCSEEGCRITFVSEKVFNMSAGASVKAKEEISGDVHSYVELSNGRYLLGLADGMGSGKKARFESMEAIELLEEFIDADIEKNVAVKIINSMLILNSEEENFSTLDFAVVDLYTGVAEFFKMGGATTFILRGNQVELIKANTLPIGMLREVEPKIQTVQLREGDIIIMVTDGLLSTPQDVIGLEETFKHFVLEAKSGDPQHMADYLMERSCNLLGGDDQDDMSIIVAKVWKKLPSSSIKAKIG